MIALVLALAGTPTLAPADPAPSAPIYEARSYAQALASALADQRFESALFLLQSHPELLQRPDGQRLEAQLLWETGHTDEALQVLYRRLADDTKDAIARFQVGEIEFARHGDRAANLAYRLALAGQLDPFRRQTAERRILELDQRKAWRISGSISAGPDTNLNSAPNVTSVQLFGLPFALDPNAKQRSGFGGAVQGSIERRLPIAADASIKLDLSGDAYGQIGRNVEAAEATASAGFEIRRGPPGLQNIGSADLTASNVWYAGRLAERHVGAVLSGDVFSRPSVKWEGAILEERVDSALTSDLSGWSSTLQLGRTKYMNASSLWRWTFAINYKSLNSASDSDVQSYGSVGRLYALPMSSWVFIEPYIVRRDFLCNSTLFNVTRRDTEVGMNLRLSKRDWAVYGASPFVQLTLSKSISNVPLSDFSRRRVSFGLTRSF